MDISLITSLYRSEAHLADYSERVLEVMEQLEKVSLSLELIIVANDASAGERAMIAELVAKAGDKAKIIPLYVPRETLYASWNRGMAASSANCVGFWNVDDIRTVAALREGYQHVSRGRLLVYFPYTVMRIRRWFNLFTSRIYIHYPALPYNVTVFRRAMRGASFFLFERSLYDKIGAFDDRFRIAGDFEWCVRATYETDFFAAKASAGTFVLHGANLSDTGNPLQVVEENIVYLLNKAWENLRPVDPKLMFEKWQLWGSPDVPQEIQQQLWGEGADARWRAWQQERQSIRRSEMLRTIPRRIIDTLRLRSLFARLGVVKSPIRRV